MPMYEYACEKCGKEFEVEQRITEAPLTEHEGCGGHVKRLISLTSFTLKGSGWYSDHYGLKNRSNGSNGSKESTEKKKTETDSKISAENKSGSDGGGKDSVKAPSTDTSGNNSPKESKPVKNSKPDAGKAA